MRIIHTYKHHYTTAKLREDLNGWSKILMAVISQADQTYITATQDPWSEQYKEVENFDDYDVALADFQSRVIKHIWHRNTTT